MTLATGTKLGPYEIQGPLGAGGMGEVYRAKDTRLERSVAIKVLPQHLSTSPEVRQRFEREAKTISQLSHSHICALYDVGNQDGVEYLVMELLEGETLSDRLARGALAPEQTLRFGQEIADALDKAHRQGIVHRDLKPGNVMLTKSGVKLLDFGLAKAMAPPVQTSGVTSLPTVMGSANENLTAEGTILGTFQYMAPEQLEGRDADARTDIFAFGCMLYEMATGRKAFTGGSQASLISSIMKEEPAPISTVSPMAPAALDRVVKRCLAKDPEERWQNAADLKSELKWIAEGGSASGIPAPVAATSARRRFSWAPWAAAVVLAAFAFLAGRSLHRAPEAPVTRSSIDLPPQMELDRWSSVVLSPDGAMLAISATGADGKKEIWVRRMDGFAVQPVAGTEGGVMPFWSPDSKSIGFFADGRLKRVTAVGGPVLTICDAQDGRGGSWSEEDVIVFAPAPFSGLSRVSASGGAPQVLTKPERTGGTHRLPWFLPGGKRLLYLSGAQTSDANKDTLILALDLATGKSTVVAKENSEGRYVSPGYLAFVRDGNLLLQSFDPSSLKLSGAPFPVAENVAFEAFRWIGNFTFSNTGRLVFQSSEALRKSRLTWFDLDGRELGQVGESAAFYTLSISPDSQRLAATVMSGHNVKPEVRVYDLERGVGTRFTFGDQGANFPIWSPDGREIAYGDPGSGIRAKPADGGSEGKLVLKLNTNVWALGWSPDGKRMLLRIQDATSGGVELADFPLEGDAKPRKLFATDPSVLVDGAISPDGQWLLYVSNETGRQELYVVPYPGLGEKRQVSTAGGASGLWLGTRSIVYFQPSDGKMFAVDFDSQGGSLRMGAPRPVFGNKVPPRGPIDVTRDGKRLLIAVPVDDASSAQIRFVSDWRADLVKK
ncbi:MAG TPA: protein kinase [Thermoanaerobaculia bacterium]|nr:protein kinase [Thermoanaerobaculia bacterium]